MKTKFALIATAAISAAVASTFAGATTVDLTTAGSSGAINGAQFFQYSADLPTGTGNFGTFLTIQQNGTEAGYNTDGTLEFNTQVNHTSAIQLKDIPLVNGFRQFALDINETASKTNPLLSLDEVRLFTTSDKNLTGYSFGSNATEVYNMDAGGDNWVKLDYSLSGSGSGRADMLMYVPDSYFTAAGATGNTYVVLYSQFGLQGNDSNGLGSSAGFEEWSSHNLPGKPGDDFPAPPASVPVPAAAWLFTSGLLGLVGASRRRKA